MIAAVSPTAILGVVIAFGCASLVTMVGALWRFARNQGRQEEWTKDVDRRLTRIERHLGFEEPGYGKS